jgi:hypothetical protein
VKIAVSAVAALALSVPAMMFGQDKGNAVLGQQLQSQPALQGPQKLSC